MSDNQEIKDLIPNEIYGVRLTEMDKNLLLLGESTPILENMNINGVHKDGKLCLKMNTEGEYEFKFQFVKDELIIPPKILGKDISKEDEELLLKGNVLLVKHNKTDLFIKIDKELNKVTVLTNKEIGVPKELGEYVLTDKDKEALASGNVLETKLLKGNEGYFLANVSMHSSGKGFDYNNVKDLENLSKDQIKEYQIKYNTPDSKDNIISKSPELNDKQEINNNEKPLIDKVSSNGEKALETAILNKDYENIYKLVNDGEKVSDKAINSIITDKDLNQNDRVALLTSLKLDPVKELSQNDKKQNKNLNLASGKNKENKLHRKAKAAKSTLDQAFAGDV